MTQLNLLIIMFLVMTIIIMASFITHKTNLAFIYIRASVLTIFVIIAGALLWIDLFG